MVRDAHAITWAALEAVGFVAKICADPGLAGRAVAAIGPVLSIIGQAAEYIVWIGALLLAREAWAAGYPFGIDLTRVRLLIALAALAAISRGARPDACTGRARFADGTEIAVFAGFNVLEASALVAGVEVPEDAVAEVGRTIRALVTARELLWDAEVCQRGAALHALGLVAVVGADAVQAGRAVAAVGPISERIVRTGASCGAGAFRLVAVVIRRGVTERIRWRVNTCAARAGRDQTRVFSENGALLCGGAAGEIRGNAVGGWSPTTLRCGA
jgi:hypothetical protein